MQIDTGLIAHAQLMDRHAHPLFFSVDPQTGLESVIGGADAPGDRRKDLDRPLLGLPLECERPDRADANEIRHRDLGASNREVEHPDLQDPEDSRQRHRYAEAIRSSAVLDRNGGVADQKALDELADRLRLVVEFDAGQIAVDSVRRQIIDLRPQHGHYLVYTAFGRLDDQALSPSDAQRTVALESCALQGNIDNSDT